MNRTINELEKELKEQSEKLMILTEALDKIGAGESTDAIGYGSRVLITWENGNTNEGRVWSVKGGGVFGINRDGYAATINLGVNKPDLTNHTLKNLSVGTYGKLEREKWILQQKIPSIKKQISEALDLQFQGILDNYKKEQIQELDVRRIIDTAEFKKWYAANSDYNTFPSVDVWPTNLRSTIVKEYILKCDKRDLYHIFLGKNA